MTLLTPFLDAPATPLPAGQPLPHRKVLRAWLLPLSTRNTAWALTLLLTDWLLLLAALAGTVFWDALWAKAACGLAAGFVTGRLFIIGHDACHQSLTPHRTLNRWVGRLAFLPSLTPYSLWEVGHNVVHHGYTNLKGVDFVWAPLTRAEYAALPRHKQWLERLYRSGWAPGLYYLVEIWFKRMYFPSRAQLPTRRPVFWLDGALVSVFAVVWSGLLALGANATGQALTPVLLTGWLLPFLFWNAMIGWVVYVHHTHAAVQWHADKTAWSQAQPFVSTTVHLTFKWGMGGVLHHIMEHTAHHVDMGIPLYHLKEAQAKLEQLLPERIVVQPFSWRWYFQTARNCKLYDFERQSWTDFEGRRTDLAAG